MYPLFIALSRRRFRR